MNVNKVLTKDYENVRLHRLWENKPNQTQLVVSLSNPPALSAVEGPVVSLPALSLSNVSNLFQTFCWGCHTND